MDSQQPEAKSQSRGAESPTAAIRRVTARRYPKPPVLGKRLALLCLKPEAWPAAAQYPFWVTLMPLVLAILIAAVAVGITDSRRTFQGLTTLGATYDARFPTLELNSKGILSTKGQAAEPLVLGDNDWLLAVDTTRRTTLDSLKAQHVLLVTDRMVYVRGFGMEGPAQDIAHMFPRLMPLAGKVTTINGTTITAFSHEWQDGILFSMGFLWFMKVIVGESFWVAMMMFLICPLVMIGAGFGERALVLPKRAAYRISAAVLVPLILLGALLESIGYPVAGVLGQDEGQVFWFFAAAALAFWSGVMAKKLYASKNTRRRAT